MRRAWSLASALGLLVMVAAGTWGCLTRSVNDSAASTSALVALGGAALTVIGIVGRGDGARTVAKARRILGGIGLVVAPIAGTLSLLQLGTDPSGAGGFLIVTVAALVAWVQAIALQAGLPFRVAASWLGLAIGFTGVAIPIAIGIAAVVETVIKGAGWGSDVASGMGAGAVAALAAGFLRVSVSNRSDRRAAPGAVRRVVFGHALPADIDMLAQGPGPILRRRTTVDVEARAARLAALDARIGSRTGSPDRSDEVPMGQNSPPKPSRDQVDGGGGLS